jgi:hypothetical protein
MKSPSRIAVSPQATDEELAAVLAALAARPRPRPTADNYEKWRRARQIAVAQAIR